MAAHALGAHPVRAVSGGDRRRPGNHPSQMVGASLRRRARRPVRRDDGAVAAARAGHERLRASLRLRTAFSRARAAPRARALHGPRARLVLPARRHRRSLLLPGRPIHMKKTLILLAWLAAFPVAGQDYPSRPIRVVVPYSAGGSSDGPMRVI